MALTTDKALKSKQSLITASLKVIAQ